MVTVVSLSMSVASLSLLITAILTDHWYETDTTQHRQNCDQYGLDSNGQKNRLMPIYHLPLLESSNPRGNQALLRAIHVGSKEEELLENWRSILGMGILETECGRPLFSTYSGLWRKCYHVGQDRDIDNLITKGKREAGSCMLTVNAVKRIFNYVEMKLSKTITNSARYRTLEYVRIQLNLILLNSEKGSV